MQARIGNALSFLTVFIFAAGYAITRVLRNFNTLAILADFFVFTFQFGAGIFDTFAVFAG